jgi:hypothetical protein
METNSLSMEEIISETEKLTSSISEKLKIVLQTTAKLKAIKEKDIDFASPILTRLQTPVFFPHTINVIQGQAGSHKSRLAEAICSAFLKKPQCDNDLLGFTRASEREHTVVYVDTERNLTEQLPFALQSIQIKAGYHKADHPENFQYMSLLQIPRKERFTVLDEYLKYIKKTIKTPLFIVLDVSTDCIEDFNKTDRSMELIDLMNIAINEHDVVFLCLIHENPSSEKARGHFGTELMNKSSTTLQVRFEKDANQNDTEIIRVKTLKSRTTAKPAPFYMKFSQESKGLILIDESEIRDLHQSRKKKATASDVADFLEEVFSAEESISRPKLIEKICKKFNASERTIENRLTEIIKEKTEIHNKEGFPCSLIKETKEKTAFYRLVQDIPF